MSKRVFGQTLQRYLVMDASTPDFSGIADLHGRSFPRGWSESEISKLALERNVTILVARTVGDPNAPAQGFNIVRHTPDEAEILSIAVDPKCRGRGLGESLMREAILRLRADRIGSLLLEVDGANNSAVKLYRKLGFRTVGNRPGYYRTSSGSGEKPSMVATHANAVPGSTSPPAPIQVLAQTSSPAPQRSDALVMRLDLV